MSQGGQVSKEMLSGRLWKICFCLWQHSGVENQVEAIIAQGCLSREPRTQWFDGFPITWASSEDYLHLFNVSHSWGTSSRLKSWWCFGGTFWTACNTPKQSTTEFPDWLITPSDSPFKCEKTPTSSVKETFNSPLEDRSWFIYLDIETRQKMVSLSSIVLGVRRKRWERQRRGTEERERELKC